MGRIIYGYSPDWSGDVKHYGTPRHSGRYPWGSGKNPQRSKNFLQRDDELKRQGLTEKERAEAWGMSTGQYRAMRSNAKNEQQKDDIRRVQKLRDAGNSIAAISRETGIPDSTVRNYLKPNFQARRDRASILADQLKEQIADRTYLDVGEGVELQLNVSKEQMQTAIALLEQEGYTKHRVAVPQASDPSKKTNVIVLTKDDVTYDEVRDNIDKVSSPEGVKFEDYGEYVKNITAPKSIDSSRVLIRYAEDGGDQKEGVLELREGVEDLSLGANRYAQVRVAVDGTHYMKGMAVYTDDIPDGYDVIYNTSKHNDIPKMSIFKEMKTDKNGNIDTENPFGASIKDQRGALNIVNEDEDWEKWSKTLSAQFLSKQPLPLAKKQLDITYNEKKAEFDELCSLTNPTIKRQLLESFADDCDSSAVHLKAAALPRQSAQVLLPVTSLKDDEIYAPSFQNGEEVVLIRYPHGAVFEIPRLKVNNLNEEGQKILGNSKTAVGINANVAQQLSGADFDGDTVTVIPTKGQNIRTEKVRKELANFNTKESYPAYKGMPKTCPENGFNKQMQMGMTTNLITDMTIKGATTDEIVRVVKHSMVIIDAEKHNLNWRQSEIDSGIKELKEKYQGGKRNGASTIISRASSERYIPDRKQIFSPSMMTEEELERYRNGEKIFRDTGKMKKNKDGTWTQKNIKVTKMEYERDAFNLVSDSGSPMEEAYANHANKLKALANSARKEAMNTGRLQMNQSAKDIYAAERASLNAKLNVAKKNAPLERQAQMIASVKSRARIEANPGLDKDDIKKIRQQEITRARKAIGTRSRNPKNPNNIAINITDREWEAIQSGAISDSKLQDILRYTNVDDLRARATPRSNRGLSKTAATRARTLLNNGYTYAEVAEDLGVSVSTLSKELNKST